MKVNSYTVTDYTLYIAMEGRITLVTPDRYSHATLLFLLLPTPFVCSVFNYYVALYIQK